MTVANTTSCLIAGLPPRDGAVATLSSCDQAGSFHKSLQHSQPLSSALTIALSTHIILQDPPECPALGYDHHATCGTIKAQPQMSSLQRSRNSKPRPDTTPFRCKLLIVLPFLLPLFPTLPGWDAFAPLTT